MRPADSLDSDNVKTGNPFAKKSHDYDQVNLMHATHVKRYVHKNTDRLTWEFTDGSSFDLKVTQQFDYNVWLLLPDEIRDMPSQQRQECALDIFWTWKKATGNMKSDMPKVTDLQPRKDHVAGKQEQRLLDERAGKHPDLFNQDGQPYTAEPITNPHPMHADELEARRKVAVAADAKLKQDAAKRSDPEPAKQDDPDAGKTAEQIANEHFGPKHTKRPVVNPGNWTHDTSKRNKFYAELQEKGWNKFGIPGPQKSKHIHAGLGVNSLHETNLSPDVALVTILVYLDKLFGKKDEVTAPATTTFTAEEWKIWIAAHSDWSSTAILEALNANRQSRNLPPIKKASEWDLGLDAIEAIVIAYENSLQNDEKASSSAESATGHDEPSAPPKASEEPAIEAPIVEPPSRAVAVIDNPKIEIVQFDPNRALEAVKGKVALLNRIMTEILVDGVDYGNVPGSEKKCLYKPGSEKLLVGFDFYDKCAPTANAIVDWKNGFFNFEYECTIYNRQTGRIEGTGIGSCNSMESKYRWRESKRVCPHCGKDAIIKGKDEYGGGWICFAKKGGCGAKFGDKDQTIIGQQVGRVPNEDIFDLVNTISKMAQKRALVAAALNATAASSVFTQDLDDLKDFGVFADAA